MARKDVLEFRRKHGRLVKGWRKILEQERWGESNHEFISQIKRDFRLRRLPTREEALTLHRLGRKLSEMGERGIKDKRTRFTGKSKQIHAKFVNGGLPSLGKDR